MIYPFDLVIADLIAGKKPTAADLERYSQVTGLDVRLVPSTLEEARDAFLDGAIPACMAVLDDDIELATGERFVVIAVRHWHGEIAELTGTIAGRTFTTKLPSWSPVYLWARDGEPVIHRRPRIDLTPAG